MNALRGRPASFNVKTALLGARVPISTKALAKKYAALRGLNLNEVVHQAILKLVA